MKVVYQKDHRSGITYAYEAEYYWDKETTKHRSRRKLIGRLNEETGEIVSTDGRCRKNSPYQKPKPTEEKIILGRLKGMTVSELKKEVLRLELENTDLRSRREELKPAEEQAEPEQTELEYAEEQTEQEQIELEFPGDSAEPE